MTWRFRRSVQVAPGVRLNYGKRGTSLSIGGHGMTTNIGPQGTYTTTSIPGTGISYRQQVAGPWGSPLPTDKTGPAAVQSGVYDGKLMPDGSVVYTDANGVEASPAAVKEIRRQGRDKILTWLNEVAKERNAAAYPLLTIHHTSPLPMDAAHYVPPAFPTPQPQPPVFQETTPLAPLELEDPNWLEEHVSLLRERVEERNEERQAEYAIQQAEWQRRDLAAQQAYAQAELQWEAKVEAWEAALVTFDAEQMQRQRMLIAPEAVDVGAITDYLRQRIDALAWPRAVETSVVAAGQGNTVSLAVRVPNESSPQAPWPAEIATVNTERMRLYYKQKLKRDVREEFVVHLYSVAFRLLSEVYGSFPGADMVMVEISAMDATSGRSKLELRLIARRAQWESIDFAHLPDLNLVGSLSPFKC